VNLAHVSSVCVECITGSLPYSGFLIVFISSKTNIKPKWNNHFQLEITGERAITLKFVQKIICLPPWNYHNLQEIQAAGRDYSFQLTDDVASVMQQHASSNCLHSPAGRDHQIKISCKEIVGNIMEYKRDHYEGKIK
jgi:hypothetical protein